MICSICSELSGESRNNRFYASNKYRMKNAFLYKDEHFCVIPSIGALKNGHCLIVPQVHCNSILNYVKATGKQKVLYELLLKMSDKLITEDNMSLLCFEHGSFSSEANYSLCSTTHAHLHVLPIEHFHIKNILQRVPSLIANVSLEIDDIIKESQHFNDYITIFNFNEGQLKQTKVLNAQLFPSQYIRKLIGEELKNSKWDWKINNDNNHTNETIEKFA